MKQNLQNELKEIIVISNEDINQVSEYLREKYKNAEIDNNCFIITKEDLAEGNLKEKGIQKRLWIHQSKFNAFLIFVKSIDFSFGKFLHTKFEETKTKDTDR